MNQKEIDRLERKLTDLRSRYAKLPQKSSFSGWYLLDEIDKIKDQIYREAVKK